jgi:hypothetical protein
MVQLWLVGQSNDFVSYAKIDVAEKTVAIKSALTALPKPLVSARAHPEWSTLGNRFQDGLARQKAILALVEEDVLKRGE